MRIEVAYRASPYTTANYLVAAFRRMGHEVCATGPGHDGVCANPDLFVWVESGGGCPSTISAHVVTVPSIAWFLDGHSQGAWHGEFAKQFTRAFSAQRGDAGDYLPVACDPETHTPDPDIQPEHDIVFVGHLYSDSPWYSRRRLLLRELAQRYDVRVYEGYYGRDMANAHARGKVVFNVSTLGDVNMRIFEGMCSGRPLLTDVVDGLPFVNWRDLVVYTDEDLYENVRRLLLMPHRAAQIGIAGREAVLKAHTYDHRAREMLACL